MVCKHFGEETSNKHRLEEKVVRRDADGQIVSDRKRNKDDRRTGCRVRYVVSSKLKSTDQNNKDKHWVGRWIHPYSDHSSHPFPANPIQYLPLKRRLEEYQ